jgi:hypothetical protein
LKRNKKFTLRVNQEERNVIVRLSRILDRSQSDAIRFALSKMLTELLEENQTTVLIKKGGNK